MKQQTLDISQRRTVTLERSETKETNPTTTQAYRSEFPSCVMGRRNAGKTQESACIEMKKLRVWGDQGTWISQDSIRERQTERKI